MTVRRGVIALVTLAAAVLVTAPTIAFTLGHYDADTALRFWPLGAEAQASKASELVATDFKVGTLEQADRLSGAALRREPVNVVAARVQALVAAARGQERATLGWARYAEGLSRRDFAIQTLLIELAVARGDVQGALVHYDRALRTKKAAGDVLFPVLFGAASDPNVLPAFAAMLGRRPEWWYDFTVKWQTQSPPVGPLFTILMAERPDVSVLRERMLAIAAMRQMVTAGRVDLAARLHDRIVPTGSPPAGTLVGGRFDSGNDLVPFAWDITSEGDLAGAVERRGEPPRSALTIDVSGDRSGTIAQQLVQLVPGRYRMTFQVGELSPDGIVPGLSIVCMGSTEPLAKQRIGVVGPAIRNLQFEIPRGCSAQTVRITGTAGENDSLPRPWITDLALRRLN